MNDIVQPQAAPAQPEAPQGDVSSQQPAIEDAKSESEKMIPYTRFQQVNKSWREAQRELAEMKSKQQIAKYDPNDMESVMGHPFVQDLMLKQAKQELTSYARDLIGNYPSIPKSVQKAVLANVRGFVKESTQDVETAKLDLQEYIESIIEEFAPQDPPPANFPVAGTNATTGAKSGATPEKIQKILNKAPEEWTDDDMKVIEEYKSIK